MDVTLNLTHACNLACPYCYAGAKDDRAMSADVAERALQLALEDDAEHVQISFFGGEPLLRFELLEAYTRLAQERLGTGGAGRTLAFTLTTNGTAFTPAKLEFLKAQKFFVGFSMDGGRAAQDASRPFVNGGSSFEAVLRGLKSVQAAGLPYEVILVTDPTNVRSLGESVRFIVAQGVHKVSLNPNFSADWTDEDLEHWERGYEEAAAVYLETLRDGRPLALNILDEKIHTWVKDGFKARDHCQFGNTGVAVAPSGNIYPCERLVGEDRDLRFCIGDVFTGFTARRDELLRCISGTPSDCTGCALSARCMNWCPCQNFADSGQIDRPGGLLCWHDQVAVRVADTAATQLFEEQNPLFLRRFYG